MFLNFLLLICISSCFGHQNEKQIEDENLPRQWDVIVSFVTRKITGMERLLKEKDDRVDQLESDLLIYKTQLAHVTQEMTSLKGDMMQKDTVVDKLVRRISDMENMAMDYMSMERGPDHVKSSMNTNTSLTDNSDRLQSFNRDQLKGVHSTSNTTQDSSGRNGQTSRRTVGMTVYTPDFIETSPNTNRRNMDIHGKHEDSSTAKRPRQYRVAPSQSNKTTVAFHATLSTTTYTADATVVYGQETLDQGDGYNPGDGIYIVPESGTYVFTWTTICERHGYFQTVLAVNGVVRGSSWTEATDVNDYHQTTAVVILLLNQGDHVFIRMGHHYGHGTIVNDNTLGSSTFSGWKLD
ncbi:uncharacterized protein LOC117317270 [Pecten maximus]|uniref:uncharacterized protein LOC117317270 n=1 Tax=Pecten maximus TaxID=6579 RepID=UPI001458D6F5|nr:uncharacterized protein LOC117317270 [Pecten maximus]